MSSPDIVIQSDPLSLDLALLDLDAEAAERQRIYESGDGLLREALQKAIDSEALIPAEHAKIDVAIARETHPLKLVRLRYYRWLVERQLTRFAKVGRMRLAYLTRLRTAQDRRDELERCTDGIHGTLHWFKYWAWSYDPRPTTPLKNTPFYPFEFQTRAIEWLEDLVFVTHEPGMVEKTREMGWTWLFICWATKHWRFSEQFTCILSSHKEKYVDDKKNQNTLFEKARFSVRMLPEFMQPDGFKWHADSSHMKLINPANGAMLNGEAPVEDLGRSGRATCALLDEHASYPYAGFPQWTSITETTPSPISLSTVKGKTTQQAMLKYDPDLAIARFTSHWTDHPWKTEEWYSTLPLKMTKEARAQEIDIDYEASQPGKVFTNWDERFVLVPWRKFVKFYADRGLGHLFIRDPSKPLGFKFEDGTRNYRIPSDWSWGRAQDRGDTEGHRRVTSWAASPRESYPLNDLRVIAAIKYHATGVALSHVVTDIRQAEKCVFHSEDFSDADISINSHEAEGERNTLLLDYGLNFEAWDTDFTSGISTIKDYIEVVDSHTRNPFHPELMGRTRLIILTDDDDSKLVFDSGSQKYLLTNSKTEEIKLVRFEMSAYHFPPEEKGKPLKKMRPEKRDDDCIDTFRGFANTPTMFPAVNPLTKGEEIERRIADGLTAEALAAVMQTNPEAAQGKWLARKAEMLRLEKEVRQGTVYDEFAEYERMIEES